MAFGVPTSLTTPLSLQVSLGFVGPLHPSQEEDGL